MGGVGQSDGTTGTGWLACLIRVIRPTNQTLWYGVVLSVSGRVHHSHSYALSKLALA